MMMGNLQSKNPQAFQQINNAIKNGKNPQEFMKQIVGGATPQQMQNVLMQAKQMGIPDEILKQVQNMK